MIVNTPYTECYIKRSFLQETPNYNQDETIFGIIAGIRFIRNRAPLFIAYLPELGAVYDKIDQCAIFEKPETPDVEIKNSDVAWWDSVSDNWQLFQFELFKGWDVTGYMSGSIQEMTGTYLWTCEPMPPISGVDYGQSTIWHEHKTKTFAFDIETGALFCVPNNKMRMYDQSLTHDELKSPDWLKVYKDSYERRSHEFHVKHFGETDKFDY